MPKSNDLTDKRVLRTKRDIERALLRLMRERDFEKITIEQILESAEYSKAAFYSHYRNKADCFRSIIDQESQSLASCYYISRVKMLITNRGGGGQYYALLEYFTHIYGRRYLYEMIFSNRLRAEWRDYFLMSMKTEFSKTNRYIYIGNDPDHSDEDFNIDLCYSVHISRLQSAIRYWIETDFSLTPEELAIQFCELNEYEIVFDLRDQKNGISPYKSGAL